MKSSKNIATYRRLRTQALWRLLAADNGPIIIGLLQTHLYEGARSLPASIFHDRISRDIEELRAQGENFPQTAQVYIASWLAAGYLERYFPAGVNEEEYELSSATVEAIRFVSNIVEPKVSATESRLTTVIQQLIRLAEETDTNPKTRIATLLNERKRIDHEIKTIEQGHIHSLSVPRALERVREIINLADELAGDFRRVRDQFEHLNRSLRERILDNTENRGEVLDSLFAGVDLIAESEAGQTFSAFWRLLTDPEQSAILDQALEQVMSRSFSAQLDIKERRFLLNLTRVLLDQGGTVHEVLQHFARSLKHFVQSREYLEQRRLNQLLKEAQKAALDLKNEVKATESLQYSLELTSSRFQSLSQWVLHDPSLQALPNHMINSAQAMINLNSIGELIAQSEINFRALKNNILAILEQYSQASIADVLKQFPATQGLGSVVGLLALGSRHGCKTERYEIVSWQGVDKQQRWARIPIIYFLREHAHEFY